MFVGFGNHLRRGPKLWALAALTGGFAWLLASGGLLAGPGAPRFPHKDFGRAPEYDVVRVVSGDTLICKVADASQRIGLIGVAAPALSQPFGREAQQWLEDLLRGETVYLDYPPGRRETDEFDRHLAYVYRAPDGLFVNLEVVRQGYATVPEGRSSEHRALFEHFEKRAKEQQRGQWGSRSPGPSDSQPAAGGDRSRAESQPNRSADGTIVYVTPSGKKYHRADCRFVRGSGTPISLKDAKARGLTPCLRCKPPE
jgi:micrococcal nuclease